MFAILSQSSITEEPSIYNELAFQCCRNTHSIVSEKCECVLHTNSMAFLTLITNLTWMASLHRSIRGTPNKVLHVLTVGVKLCQKVVGCNVFVFLAHDFDFPQTILQMHIKAVGRQSSCIGESKQELPISIHIPRLLKRYPSFV